MANEPKDPKAAPAAPPPQKEVSFVKRIDGGRDRSGFAQDEKPKPSPSRKEKDD